MMDAKLRTRAALYTEWREGGARVMCALTGRKGTTCPSKQTTTGFIHVLWDGNLSPSRVTLGSLVASEPSPPQGGSGFPSIAPGELPFVVDATRLEVEHDISPPMAAAVTLPIQGSGVAIYIAQSAWETPYRRVSDEQLLKLAGIIAKALGARRR